MKTITKEINLKNKICEACLEKQKALAATTKEAMDMAQQSANEEKGSMEEKFESFREQLIRDRDMFARKLGEHISGLDTLRQIDANRLFSSVQLGSVVITEKQKFFISIGLGEIKLADDTYFAISVMSPLYQQMEGKKADDSYDFRGVPTKIISVF